jgi:hypothetical protein
VAGDWIKMGTGLGRHPKVVRIASALGADRLRVVGGLHAVWCLFDEHSEDGRLDGYTAQVVDDLIGWPGFTCALALVGWAEEDGESLVLPNFESHNGQSAKRRAMESDRKRESRRSSGSGADKSVTREEKRREENIDQEQKQKIGSPTGSRLPAEWVLPRSWGEWAEQERPDLDVRREAASFADYWHGVAGAKARKADWQATWRNWIRKADGMRRRAEQQAQPSARMGKLTKLEEMKNGLGNSGNHHGDATADLLGARSGTCLRLGGGNGNGVGGGG